jgi:cytoskeletal protein CcmA (bactofilin family)
MWKKEEAPTSGFAPEADRTPHQERTPAPSPVPAGERATIGRSITIRGDVTGDEDLLIQGRVDGSVDLKQHAVTIGRDGEVKASIAGRVVGVEGRVEGNITSEEQVVLRSSAWVQGDITAPRLVLEDGARFRGGVDMGDLSDRGASGGSASTQAKRPGSSSAVTPAAETSGGTNSGQGKGSGDSSKGKATSGVAVEAAS